MKKDASSEEKLLNLIRKKNPADKKENKSVEFKPDISASLRSSVQGFSNWPQSFFRILFIFCLVCLLYIGSNMFFFKESRDVTILSQVDNNTEKIMPEDQALLTPKPFSEYAQAMNQRDI